MPAISLRAHFDGTAIQLDEPYELPRDAQLIVTILPDADGSRADDWSDLSVRALSRAYGQTEPTYTDSDVEP